MGFNVLKDAARSTVTSYTQGSGSITLASVSSFQSPTTSAPILITAVTAASYGLYPETYCTYQATGLSGTTFSGLTVVSGTDYAFQAGDIVEMRICATHLNALEQTFGASGSSHAPGLVPDPGATAGTTHFLREDGTWVVPSGGSGSGTVNSGTTNQLGYFAAAGTTISGLTLGTGLSISGSTITATGGSGSGTVNSGTTNQLGYYAASGTAISGLTLGTGLSISGSTISASGGGSGTVNSGTSGNVAYYSATGTAVSGESLSALIDAAIDNTQGDLLYRGASNWTNLTAGGTVGGLLATGGASANPAWTTNLTSGTNGNLNFAAITHGTVAAGDLWYASSDQGTFSIGRASGQARLGGCIFSCGSCTALSNFTTAASIFGSPTNSKGSLTIPANTLAIGNVLRWEIDALVSATASGPNFFHNVILNGTTILSNLSSATIGGTAQTNATAYSLKGFLTILAIGASGAASGLSWIQIVQSTAAQVGTVASPGATSPVASVTVATNSNALFDIKLGCSTASSSNTFQLQSFQLFLEN
jgi:hypothetical protein